MPAPWLEDPDEFEGVGADPRNPRYDPVDEDNPDSLTADRLWFPRQFTDNRRLTLAAAPQLPAHYIRRFDWHDGSHWQPDAGPMDLGKLMAVSPGDALAWKATQSTGYVDPTLAFVQREMARLRVELRLLYHWLSSTTDPEQQAAHFLKTVGMFFAGMLAMLDAEEGGITVDWCLGWLQAVEKVLKRPCSVYSGLYVAGGSVWRDPRIRESKWGMRPMHLAAYVSLASLLNHLVRTGTLNLYISAWQFTSDGDFAGAPATTPGITGRADWNAFFDRPLYRKAAQLTTDPPMEDDMKLSILARDADHADPYRWVTDNLVRVLPTVESIGRLVAKGLVEAGQDITHPEYVSDEVLAGIPLVESLECRFTATPATPTQCLLANGVAMSGRVGG